MAIKSGQILHVANDVTLVERLQTGGPGSLNIPKERIYELGNYQSVATIRDTPDLQYSLESLDTTCALEAMLTRLPLASASFDLGACRPLDLATPLKPGKNAPAPFTVVQSVGIPYLYPESLSYRFGLRDNASQTVSLRGDSIFYCPGVVYVQTTTAGVAAGGTIATTNPAGLYTDSSGARRVLSVEVDDDRLSYGPDYSVASAGSTAFETATVTFTRAVTAGKQIRIMYFSNTSRDWPQTVHTSAAVKPAALRGRDIDIYVGPPPTSVLPTTTRPNGAYDPADVAGSQQYKWTSVQSANVDWRVTLDADEEFGNYYRVGQDFEVPDVTGTVNIKPRNPDEILTKLRQATGVTDVNQAIGPNLASLLCVDIVLKNPVDGSTLKRLRIPDARFDVPGYAPRVQQKMTMDLSFESDGGQLLAYPA